jgi:hypothetical protein
MKYESGAKVLKTNEELLHYGVNTVDSQSSQFDKQIINEKS